MTFIPQASAYGWLMLAGTLISLWLWLRMARRDERLIVIYVAALGGAFVGAKAVYLAAEGWLHWHDPNRWFILATGKTITGALLGGYGAVEWAKRHVGYLRPTGDRFAIVTALGVLIGRIGCWRHGCCLGQVCAASWYTVPDAEGHHRWPASLIELAFNACALVAFLILRHRRKLPGQHFHLYLAAYGLFRFLHETVRDTPRLGGPFSGYQVAALGVAVLGVGGFCLRRSSGSARPTTDPAAIDLTLRVAEEPTPARERA